MALLDLLQAHQGGAIRIKSDLFWYCGPIHGWDQNPGRICLVLDAALGTMTDPVVADASAHDAMFTRPSQVVGAFLLIDGRTCWIWVSEQDVEIIDDG